MGLYMQIASTEANNTAEHDLGIGDLGPLAWVLDELRKSLDGATKALKRFVRDAEQARGSDLASLDAAPLRIARQQLHQAVGALEMVGLPGPALVLRAMEAVAQRFVQQPELCSEDAAARVERAGFALTEYLEVLLAGKPVSPVALFSQYREVQEVVKADRIHPADLWPVPWQWLNVALPTGASHGFDAISRTQLDSAVLQIMQGAQPALSTELAEQCAALARSAEQLHVATFLALMAACFQAIGARCLAVDLYVKRVLPRVLLQYASLARGETSLSDRLAHDLLFFCSQAKQLPNGFTPLLEAVRQAYGLARSQPVAYLEASFGRFDPVVLAQARKRIAAAKESWTALAGGDTQKFRSLTDQFSLVSESITKLHPSSTDFAQALTRCIETVVRTGQAPSAPLGMEVATSILYLEAAFQDLDPNDPYLSERTTHLAQRLDSVASGHAPQPLESWMEDLYRRVSDKQTMGSVVGELKLSLGELEKSLDQFFRNPQDKNSLQRVPDQLAQMRGVLSVLGLDHATQAVGRMRDSVEAMLVTEIDEARAREAGTFDQLGNNLGALGFLIDMLSYQPALAKKLFVYDAQTNELKPLMGRSMPAVLDAHAVAANLPATATSYSTTQTLSMEALALVHDAGNAMAPDMGHLLEALATHAALDDNTALAQAAREASEVIHTQSNEGGGAPSAASAQALHAFVASASPAPVVLEPAQAAVDFEEDDLRGIFLEEAAEVIAGGRVAVQALHTASAEVSELTTLRRAFHTLKGSSRMVELPVFGDAAWSMEQVLNTWLADQKPATEPLLHLCSQTFDAFAQWAGDIAAGTDQHWTAAAISTSADQMRNQGTLQPIVWPAAAPNAELANLDLADIDFDFELGLPEPAAPSADAHNAALLDTNLPDPMALEVDFEHLSAASFPAPEPAVLSALPQAAESLDDLNDFSFDLDLDLPDNAQEPHAAQAPSVDTVAALSPQEIDALFAQAQTHDEPTPTSAAPLLEPTQVLHSAPAPAVTVHHAIEPDAIAPLAAVLAVPVATVIAQAAAPEVAQAEPAQAQPKPAEPIQSKPAYVLHAVVSAPVEDPTHSDEPVKIIGSLRIGLALYNVYLNEADEWSRRLLNELGEWALELHRPVPDTCIGFAHSLAGSSATVGFASLSELARALEHSLQHLQMIAGGTEERAAVCAQAAEEIRHLLHQFAAGFLKEARADVLASLKTLQLIPSAPEPVAQVYEAAPAPTPARVSKAEPLLAPVVTLHEAVLTVPPPTTSPAALVMETVPVLHALEPVALRTPASASAGQALAQQLADPLADDEDNDIDVLDALDPDLFPIFDEEAAELMPQLGSALRQWVDHPSQQDARASILRVLHTLKGSARLAGALRLGELTHRMESRIERIGSAELASAQLEPLLHRFDTMQAVLQLLRHPEAAPATVFVSQPAPPGSAASIDSRRVAVSAEPALQPASITPHAPLALVQAASAAMPTNISGLPLRTMPSMAQNTVVQAGAGQSVRVRSQLLDRLVNQAGEVMITRTRLETELSQLRGSLGDLTGNLDRLRAQLRDIELQAESQMQSRLAQAKDSAQGFDPLEFDRFTRVQELTRMMAESVNDVATVQRNLQRTVESTEDDLIAQARQTRELQRDLLRTRMVEFEGISDRLYRVVRQASKDSGKQVKLDIIGGSIEMDRGVLDRMTPAFEHLLRNCVAHGIEDAAGRSAAGKDASGVISIDLRQEGNDVSVEFRDDGAGLNLPRIREKALAQGLLAAGQSLSDAEAANLIFTPGFSTAAQVTELSGRGIGMDVVRSDVNALGGRIETATQVGQGTSFKLVLPLTTAVTQVVMLRAGKLTVGVPANVVATVLRATPKDVQQAYNTGRYTLADGEVPFFWSGALLQASARSEEALGKTIPVVIFSSAAQRVAMHVDEVLGNQEVVVKNLGPQLARLPGLAGMSVMASGAVALIYNPVALATVYGERARALSADHAEPHMLEGKPNHALALPVAAQIPLVLVVDDSITVRRVTQRLLVREGFRVALAADGLQALERLQDERPAVVLSDIEMPRMDGFDLARNIRGDARLHDLPIIMITSRIAEKHREHAKELGVNHYLGKPYPEEELMSLVKHYCALFEAV